MWGAIRSFSSKPTFRPTKHDCSNSFWHVDTEAPKQGCTNYGVDTMQEAALLYQTAEVCCVFSFQGLDCSVRDNCRLTNSLILAERNLPRPGESCENWWHPDTLEGLDGCSNYLHFPVSWKQPKNKANLLFDTSQECCQKLYLEQGNHCKVYNYCEADPTKYPTPPPTPWPISPTEPPTFAQPTTPAPKSLTTDVTSPPPCESAKWHIAAGANDLTCTNGLDYPEPWNDPRMSANFLFDSHFDCCKRFSPFDPNACGRVDVCEDTTTTTASIAMTTTTTATLTVMGTPLADDPTNPETSSKCLSARWHMTQDFSKCSNNFEYLSSWPLFDHPTECCVGVFNYVDCEIEDICASGNIISMNTKTRNPSYEPTPKPSSGIPTREPTPNPTSEPIPNATARTDKTRSPKPEPTPKPSSGMPTREPAPQLTSKPMPNPTKEPMTKLSTKKPTQKPLQNSSAGDDSNNHCSGKSRRQCVNDSQCHYKRTGRICVEIETTSQIANKPTATITTPTNSVANRCGGKLRKQCIKDTECTWDTSEQSCDQLSATPTDIHENKGNIAATTATTELTTPASVNCDRWHPKTITDRTCSNSQDYPSLWDNYPYSEQYVFNSFKQCCKKFYGGTCNQEDVCETIQNRE
mmetsp:Transcript_19468/g.41640  ORF Transcript_19468/g.41640 Transcript_19468/m.41640 type:complete len:635 (+) Transcript_19468:2027-3931(+)